MAAVISVFGISSSMGPVLEGVFTDRVSWRWCFYVYVYTQPTMLISASGNLPSGLLAPVLVVFFMRLKPFERNSTKEVGWKSIHKHFDFVGIVLLLGFVSCLCIALQDGGVNQP